MRAWLHSSLLLATLLACGGSTDTSIDGGDDGSTTPDVNVLNDGGTIPDATLADGDVTDATVDVADDVSTGPFDPSQLGTNLVLWLEGDKGVTQTNGAVSAWADQTTYHNDASGGTGQGAHEPTLNATAINNLPAVEFAIGTNNYSSQYLDVADSASLEFGAGDFAIFMVAQYSNPTTGTGAGQGTFYNKVAGNSVPTGPQLYGNAYTGAMYEGMIRARINQNVNVNSTAATYNDGKYHRIGIRRSGTTLEVWTDGTSTSLTPDAGGSIDVSATGSDVTIGASTNTGYVQLRLVGGIAEVVGVKGTLSDGDTSSMDAYFKTKYAL